MWQFEMRHDQSGFMLPFLLIINIVILCLVLANARMNILDTQSIKAYEVHSQLFYGIESSLNDITRHLKESSTMRCLYDAKGINDYFDHFQREKEKWCVSTIHHISAFHLIEKLPSSCQEHVFLEENKYAVRRYRINMLTIQPHIQIQRTVVFPNEEKICPPESVFAIKNGMQTYRWRES